MYDAAHTADAYAATRVDVRDADPTAAASAVPSPTSTVRAVADANSLPQTVVTAQPTATPVVVVSLEPTTPPPPSSLALAVKSRLETQYLRCIESLLCDGGGW